MLRSRLQAIARREVEAHNLQLSPYAMNQIEQLIGQGLQRMRINHADEHAGYVMRAERNLAALITYLRDYAKEAGSFPRLNNTDLDNALTTSPAFWPFRSSG